MYGYVQFEKQFEDLDVSSKVMESSMSTSTSQSMPMGQVDALMQQVLTHLCFLSPSFSPFLQRLLFCVHLFPLPLPPPSFRWQMSTV